MRGWYLVLVLRWKSLEGGGGKYLNAGYDEFEEFVGELEGGV